MPLLRFLHKAWNIFWVAVLSALVLVTLTLTLAIGVAQLPVAKNYLLETIEDKFSERFEGVLTVGSMDGFVPFEFNLADIKLYSDSASVNPVFSTDSLIANLDVALLFQKRIVINGLEMYRPYINFQKPAGIPAVLKAFKAKESLKMQKQDSSAVRGNIENGIFEIIAPVTIIKEGIVELGSLQADPAANLPSEWRMQNLNAEMFIQYNTNERFLDIERMSFDIPGFSPAPVKLFGQIYNNNEFFELNAFNLNFQRSSVNLSGEARGVDITKPDLISQLKKADYNLILNSLNINPTEIKSILPELNIPDSNLKLAAEVAGNLDSLSVDELSLEIGDSFLEGEGYAINLLSPENFRFRYNLYQSIFAGDQLTWMFPKINEHQQQAITNSSITGTFSGGGESFTAGAAIISPVGNIDLESQLNFAADTTFSVFMKGDSVDVSNLLPGEFIQSSLLNFEININGNSLNFPNSNGDAEVNFVRSRINGAEVDSVHISAIWKENRIDPSVFVSLDSGTLTGSGSIKTVGQEFEELTFSGSGSQMDFAKLSGLEEMQSSVSDLNYEIELKGSDLSNLEGQMSLDITSSVSKSDTLGLHQIYADITTLSNGRRRLRFTSTPFDFSLTGSILPEKIIQLSKHWGNYFKERYNSEIAFNKETIPSPDTLKFDRFNLDLNAHLKNLSILKYYFPSIPTIRSDARFAGNVNTDSERLLFNIEITDPFFEVNEFRLDSLQTQLTGSFRYNSTLKDFASLQMESQVQNLEYKALKIQNADLTINQNSDSLFFSQDIGSISGEAELKLQARGALREKFIAVSLDDFSLGNDEYVWKNEGINSFIYTADEKLFLNELKLVNDEQLLRLDGVFSQNPQDSVAYTIQNLDIRKISDLIDGRADISGIVDGNFSTRTLTRNPSIQGDLDVLALAVNNRIIGDISMKSRFEPEKNRFDTSIEIVTDSLKYPQYFTRTGRNGQNILIDGYINAPQRNNEARLDTLFYFDVDFKNVDMWIIPFIAPKAFDEMEGQVSGDGYIVGNFQDFNFNVDYQTVDAVYTKPRFLETFYYISGGITANSERGLNFNSLFIVDPTGGTGILDGFFDFTSFTGESEMDIRIKMDELQFLKNSFDAAAPFFGDAFGSGEVRLYGTNYAPVLESQGPITVTSGTNIGIPLLEETEFNENTQFIRKVKSFEFKKTEGEETEDLNFAGLRQIDPTTLTFDQRFTLDLQFVSRDPLTVRLIFDPVTGDVITSRGTGRIRITLQDQQVSMFGNYEIVSGSYQFVSGDVISRRFSLQPGGQISWQGPPDDASLNVNAVFRTRTSVNSLSCIETNVEAGQRVPVEIVLNLGGTISNIENQFFFRIPSDFNIGQYSAFQTQINNLNATQDEKLIQASSLLITGNFIPTCDESNTAITQRISGGSAILNPLLSNQVISPLLSNQINALLNSDVSSLDIDFNLNAYNEVDLGVALRLYNNRLVLRREGQITGQQSTIGDLGATYRINRTLSITAFHREDPTFGSFDENSSAGGRQDINGLGIEAQVEFNSGKDLKDKIKRFFNKLFGRKEQNEEPVAQNEN